LTDGITDGGSCLPAHTGRSRLALAEPATSLTDLALAVETAAFATLLVRDRRVRRSRLGSPVLAFLGTTAVASLAGALLHGPIADQGDPRHRALWRIATGSVGVAAFSAWWLGARLVLPGRAGRIVTGFAALLQMPYIVRAIREDVPFRAAINAYLPGVLVLSLAFGSRLRRPAERGAAARALLALASTGAAAAVQTRRIGIHPRYFDHNALYHVLQAVGIAIFVGAARDLATVERQPDSR
jgi:hypothetical protein